MRAIHAVKLTAQVRLGFEISLARARIERAYKCVQDEIHGNTKISDAAMIELHEAEQILSALERVSGDFYRRIIDNAQAYREERKREAKEATAYALAVASENKHSGDGGLK